MIDADRLARIRAVVDGGNGVRPPDEDVRPPDKPQEPARRSYDASAIADTILARSTEPWVDLRLGSGTLGEVRLGGIVLMIGGTGGGKTSLAASLAIDHAHRAGPVVAWSLELPADVFGARAIGIRTGTSWKDVLRGGVSRDAMVEALGPRLSIVPRRIGDRAATIDDLRAAIVAAAERHPGEPIMILVDYAQLVESGEAEIRRRVADAMVRISALAEKTRCLALVLSQGSRVATRALKSGEAMGAETTDAGAESADLERWADMTIAIGGHGEQDAAGIVDAPISIGKSRMDDGDIVHPGRYHGPSGRWWLGGEARPTADVRAERKAAKASADVIRGRRLLVDAANRASSPQTRDELRAAGQVDRNVVAAAALAALQAGDLVYVRQKRPRSSVWLLWTPDKAAAAGIPIVDESERGAP
jgi:hypothetical protein